MDLDDGVAPSTVAMVILFGSLAIATVGMAVRTFLSGDLRAIRAALSIQIDSPFVPTTPGGHQKSSGSVLSRMSYATSETNATKVRPWEPSFVSTFVLFYHTTLFGIVLFGVHLIDNHPLHGAARSQSARATSTRSEFDADQFLFWIFILVAYGYCISWRRNDGKIDEDHKPDTSPSIEPSPTAKIGGNISVRRRKHGADASTAVSKSSVSGASSEGSDISKRLEDVLLDDDASFNSILDTIDGGIKDRVDNNAGWLEQGSKFFGFQLNGSISASAVHDFKPEEDVLNRFQTLELKGFLTIVMLFYRHNSGGIHQAYLGSDDGLGSDDSSIDSNAQMYENLSNLGMTTFLFLAGYAHTFYIYFSTKRDAGRMTRVWSIIFRTNCSAAFLSLVTGKAGYLACPTITFWFLLVWLVMHFRSSFNHDQHHLRVKLLGFAICIFLVWDCEIARALSPNKESLIWEWYSNAHLHHWAPFCGMIFAINQPVASLQLRKLESHPFGIAAKGLIFIALCAAVRIWAGGPLQMPTHAYNVSHPYFGIVPVLAFVYTRNISGAMRCHHIGAFTWVGRYSLEAYLLHFHAFTGAGCIILVPGYPRCNFLLLCMLLLMAARVLHHVTTILRLMILPDEESQCIHHASVLGMGVAVLYSMAKVLRWADMVSVWTITAISLVSGNLLYQSVLDATWVDYRDSGLKFAQRPSSSLDPGRNAKLADRDESNAARLCPPLAGTLAILFASLVWRATSNDLQTCGATANDGQWVSLNSCIAQGKIKRKFHATNYIGPNECDAQANANLQWAWREPHCGYRYRNDLEVQQQLHGKRIVVIGDSSLRSLFLSLCGYMGDSAWYDNTASHSDLSKKYGSTMFEFKWAPLSRDIVTKLRSLTSGSAASMKRDPDLVIAGGGTWDRLTNDDRASQQESITKLAKWLGGANGPVVWFSPPTINTQALNSDEKRTQMSEPSIEEMRHLFAELGVTSSASFVLDGPSFTKDRVAESFDGIHYPPSVYDAGVQILFNALDRLLPSSNGSTVDHFPRPGTLGSPYLGLMMLCIISIGLFFFDGYFGFSYVAQFFVMNETVSPAELHTEAFAPMFQRQKAKQHDEGMQDASEDGGETTELIGRSSSSLSKRR